MATPRHHFLLTLVFLPAVTAMPEPETISPDSWEPPLETPPPPFPLDGRFFFENVTGQPGGSLLAYCQRLQSVIPAEQIPWFCLCIDCKGKTGAKGDRGDRGLPGIPGSPGRRGLTGFRGPPGFVGRPGIKGQKGDEGDKGSQGPQGFVGPKGGRGFKGEKGERGLEGLPGDPGPKGDDGVCPDSCDTIQGPEGIPGLPGPAGPRGLPGVPGAPGSKGVKGDMGVVGHPGSPGSDGVKGEPGLQGECDCTDGLDGDPGQKGSKGNQGDQGEMGPPGDNGLPGAKGDMGYMGPPGPCMPAIQSAFSAQLENSFPPPNTPVVFGYVVYNVQGSYDPTSGLYTAPINGTYVFSYHLTVYARILKVGLFHNFEPIIKTTDPSALGTTSHSIILHLSRGDQVWLQVKDHLSNGMFAGAEAASTFSGYLLHPDSCDMAFLRIPVPVLTPPENGYSWGDALGYSTNEYSTPPTTTGSS
uniref:inner ear-specific collagen n=1 Tax=Doryrhamphus excisus TaxID=161450 RepID=UPI0025AE8D36|nr:inner ear-specific collagen [Doryrhamphus excisus]